MEATAKRLLILDDDPMIGETIQRIAEFSGFEVEFTPEATCFFERVVAWQPTHIAIDLIMPAMDGVQVLVQLGNSGCKAKIIISSGVGSRILDAAGRSAKEHGLDIAGVLAKPFSPNQLRTLLNARPPQAAFPSTKVTHPSPQITANELARAIERQEFFLAYQPKVDCNTGDLVGVEALIRWAHPTYGLVSPLDFIPLAESSGHIDAITEYVIEQSLAWLASQCLLSPSDSKVPLYLCDNLILSVNISAKTLTNVDLFERARGLCKTYAIAPDRLIFELTETSAMEDPRSSLDLLTRLRMMGFHLSIDDFGTGFSSMLQLVRLPFSEIKVDKSFVMTAMKSQESRTVVKFIVELGHSLGLRCTAEGVEDVETLIFLRGIGCHLAQGYYIAKPMPGQELSHWLSTYIT